MLLPVAFRTLIVNIFSIVFFLPNRFANDAFTTRKWWLNLFSFLFQFVQFLELTDECEIIAHLPQLSQAIFSHFTQVVWNGRLREI